MREDSSSGHGSTSYARQPTNYISIERRIKRRTKASRPVSPPKSRARDTRREIFRAQGIDPEADRELVADAVKFVMTASSHGCITLISKVAENLKYKRSLEEKVKLLNRENQKLKSLPKHSVPITLESEMSRLTKACTGLKDSKIEKLDDNSELLLPGVVPYAAKTSDDLKSSKFYSPPPKTITKLQDKTVGAENVGSLHPSISSRKESLSKKSCADTGIQTFCESFRLTPALAEQACLPKQQIDSQHGVAYDESCTVLELMTQLKQELARSQQEVKMLKMTKERQKNCEEVETQTECETLRKPLLIDRACSPKSFIEIEPVPPIEQQFTQSENEKIHSQGSGKKLQCNPLKNLQGMMHLTERRPSSGLSVTNGSSKSFPTVKSRRTKCSCATCVQVKKGHVEKGKRQSIQKEERFRTDGSVFAKEHRTMGENNHKWHKTHECSSDYGVFVPVEEVQHIKCKKDIR